jgi:hypothetical protein
MAQRLRSGIAGEHKMKKSADRVAGWVSLMLAAWTAACSQEGTQSAKGPTQNEPTAGAASGSGPTAGAASGGNPIGGAPEGGAASAPTEGGAGGVSTAGAPTLTDADTDPLAGLPTGSDQLQLLCARNNGDEVAKAFCGSNGPPTITSLRDLQLLFGLDLTDPHKAMGALVTQSTSLARRLATPVNPRAIIVPFSKDFGPLVPTGDKHPHPTWVTMAFVRGEQFVELASKDPTANDALRFYLFNFKQECNSVPGGCTPGDLFTPDGEKHMTSYSLYEDVDVANTSLDCAQCHQMQGPGTAKRLIHQEFGYSWGHWAMQGVLVPELRPLCNKFNEMHAADEDYAGIPNAYIGCTQGPLANDISGPSNGGPQALDQFLYDNNQSPEYNPGANFHGKAIFYEVIGYEGQNQQPEVNVPIGVSPSWKTLYDAYVPGQSLEVPYHDLFNTDPQKMSTVIAAYKAVMAGTKPKSELPDMSDMLVKEGLADMSFTPQPNLTGRQILTAMCQQCHNSNLNQNQSRARFNVQKLDDMSRAERDEAIRRIHLPATSVRHMPPHRFHELSAADIETVTQELMR